MSEVFFIADTHFGHKGIITFSETKEYRKFDNIEEHDEALIKRWNSVVGKGDMVWVLGDFCFGKRNLAIADRLKGHKKLVLGNHDMYATADYLKYFNKVYGCCQYQGAILTHMPVHKSQFPRYYMNIHGHLHHKNLDRKRYINVSAEQQDLTPIPYDEVLNKWAEFN